MHQKKRQSMSVSTCGSVAQAAIRTGTKIANAHLVAIGTGTAITIVTEITPVRASMIALVVGITIMITILQRRRTLIMSL